MVVMVIQLWQLRGEITIRELMISTHMNIPGHQMLLTCMKVKLIAMIKDNDLGNFVRSYSKDLRCFNSNQLTLNIELKSV